MTLAQRQDIFIARMIEEMNRKGFIRGVYVGHECRPEHLYFHVYSFEAEDREHPYIMARMLWDDVRMNLDELGFLDEI